MSMYLHLLNRKSNLNVDNVGHYSMRFKTIFRNGSAIISQIEKPTNAFIEIDKVKYLHVNHFVSISFVIMMISYMN